MEQKIIPIIPARKRECGDCTLCCDGWLVTEVYGHKLYPGQPCFFMNKRCTIYENRPEDPCRKFQCVWLAENWLPEWFRPDLSRVIITKQLREGIEYFIVAETDSPMSSKVLNYLVLHALNNHVNLAYFIDGGINRIGSKEFLSLKF